MKLFVDDMRKPPDDSWVVCRNVEDAKEVWSENFEILTDASLDHDLGVNYCRSCAFRDAEDPCFGDVPCDCTCHTPVPSGYDLLKWVAQEGLWPPNRPTVHSANPVGAKNMRDLINDHYGQP